MGETRRVGPRSSALVLTLLLIVSVKLAVAQNNYEIQVYGSQTVAPKTTLVALHSNLIADGTKSAGGAVNSPDQLYPTNDTLHETIEATQGITSWSQVGFYVFTSAGSGQGWQWVGDHIRTQVRAPDSWQWPVGASLSVDFGYQRPGFSTDTWTLEITPVVDKQLGRLYFAVDPAFERSFHGQSVSQGVDFAPSAKFSYAFNKYISGGLEYYGDYGSLHDISSFHNQQQQFFPVIDLNLSPDWEVNIGVGFGVTASTDDWIWKAIIGRRFDWTRHPAAPGSTQ
ncbi:MAG TPA: hypothetical protein VMD58_01615 [Acidobacteriaceae bacterium]|nr:hypothetical protein [Acidobacteriaceae bacterium]